LARKLTVLSTLASGVALVVACVAFGVYDRSTSRETALRNLSVQAQIIGSNSVAALLFNDPQAAESTLAALAASPSIISAAVYDRRGHVFARFNRSPGEPPREPDPVSPDATEAQRFTDREIVVLRRIAMDGRPVGSVAIRSDLRDLDARRAQYVGMIGTVLLASVLVASLMSWLSQRTISGPIEELAGIARRISDDKDYSVRARAAHGTDEMSVLTQTFNDMLTHIQARDRSLHEAHQVLEDRVQQRTAELEAVNKELEAFSYSVSHDLRAPLRHVTGFVALLEDHSRDQLDAQSARYLQTISQAAKRMGQLIDDLLAFSRIGRGQFAPRAVDLNDVVREAWQEVNVPGATAGREVAYHTATLPSVEGDPSLLRLAMINLLSNALKYTAPRRRTQIDVGASDAGANEVVVFVRDNGVGFDMQYADKLFGVFQRLHRADEFEGTGIGLANVKRIVHRHGGRVWAEARPDQGATFYFSLPTTQKPATGRRERVQA
jgi:signal transduction histidine kinase